MTLIRPASGVDRDALAAQHVADAIGIRRQTRPRRAPGIRDETIGAQYAVHVWNLVPPTAKPAPDSLGTANIAGSFRDVSVCRPTPLGYGGDEGSCTLEIHGRDLRITPRVGWGHGGQKS